MWAGGLPHHLKGFVDLVDDVPGFRFSLKDVRGHETALLTVTDVDYRGAIDWSFINT
jgi:hypothetical protein